MRTLTSKEQERLAILTNYSVSATLIEPTATGLKKSIMDATHPVRNYLKEQQLHDYTLQAQGPQYKIFISSIIYDVQKTIKSKASLYRPKTKKGDPRIWFYGLTKHVMPNDILALIHWQKQLHVINITQIELEKITTSVLVNPIKDLLETIRNAENAVALELLEKLKVIAKKGLIPSMVDADTSVGRTLETQLGIDINSSKQPDYKGIELKSFRAKRKNRKNLFGQIANWKLSKLKSSAEILDTFGYWRGEDFKLYCTVSTLKPNSQGLSLKVNTDIQHLIETSDQIEIDDFLVWELKKLHQRLLQKHRETFWVEAESQIIDSKEYFQYTIVEHTQKPIVSQFDILLEQGIITNTMVKIKQP